MRPNGGARDVQRRQRATGWAMGRLVVGLWGCLVGLAVAEDPPQPYLEEPRYEMAPHLLGSEGGFRDRLADAGVTILADNTGFSIGNANGGFDQAFDYAGHGDYCAIADGGKLGIHDGLYLKLRAEHRYGETIVGNVGCFISPTLIADLPVYGSEEVYLTNVLLTQELTDACSVFAGDLPPLNEATPGARIPGGRNQGRARNATRKGGAGRGHHPQASRGRS
jgi:hypothetical protein